MKRMILSRNITCDSSILSVLTQETIKLANLVVNEIGEDDLGLFVQINDLNNLHAALALPHSPVAQGADANASLEAFRNWLIDGARTVNAGCQVPENLNVSLAFHHLTSEQAINIAYGQWLQHHWYIEIRNSGFQEFATAFLMEGTGRRRATFSILPGLFG
ncbi:hypothetical protein AeRB84_011121 [Aphanomyces euteiches]|nr:hypothetical protein AeRB84_011121 [Aphanomyces euteiches]